MRSLAESRLAEVDRILADLNRNIDELEPMDRSKLMKLAKSGKVTILDVRPEDEFAAEHLPHAISVPLSSLKSLMSKLPRDQQIVAYCRGPYCVLATEAVEMLRKKGFQAARLSDGIREWRDAGMLVVSKDRRAS
jgi:rhodanese-related sulfurtransferase